MVSKDISTKINKLKSIATFGIHSFMGLSKDAFVKIFGEGDNAVSFINVGNIKEYNSIVNYLYIHTSDIRENYSINIFENKLAELLRRLNREDREAKKNDWEEFSCQLLSSPDEQVKIVAPIFGVGMNESKIKLGDFTIFKSADFVEVLNEEYASAINLMSNHDYLNNEYLIGLTIKAKDIIKCYEIAEEAFYSFENVANFITGGFHKTTKIGIFNYYNSKTVVSLAITPKGVNEFRNELDCFDVVQIDSQLYRDAKNGNDQIWGWVMSPKNDFKAAVLKAIEWCGRAIVEPDDSKALLQYIIAIESLLQYDEGKFIVPSIVSQLSDMIAFLLGDSYAKRKSYATYIKELYRIRSSISHNGKKDISSISLHNVNVLCHSIIRKVVSHEPFKKFETKKAFCDYLINLKYGQPDS